MAKKLKYQELLEENGLEASELPPEIKKQISVLTPLVGNFNKKKTESLKKAVIKKDIEICNLIADHLGIPPEGEEEEEEDDIYGNENQDEDDNDDNQDDDNQDDNGQGSDGDNNPPPPADNDTPPPPPPPPPPEPKKQEYAFGTLEQEERILAECTKGNGFIPADLLEQIINQEPDYPTQKVYSIKLRKVYMKSLYKLE